MHRKNHDFENISLNPYRKDDIERLKIAKNDSITAAKSKKISFKNFVDHCNNQFFYQKFYSFVEKRHDWDAVREVHPTGPGDVSKEEFKMFKSFGEIEKELDKMVKFAEKHGFKDDIKDIGNARKIIKLIYRK